MPDALVARLRQAVVALPAGEPEAPRTIAGNRPNGLEMEILAKDTRATAISFGLPIAVTRAHPDFAALSVARAWLGEHRASSGQLYQRLREVRGLNYGDYAYIEAFPRGMFLMLPDAGTPRRGQIFEVWIRPVVPENGAMALRIALWELRHLVTDGLTREQFEAARGYLLKAVYVMTASQNHQLGYALDSRFYGIGEFTATMREHLAALTVDEVNEAIRRHFSASDLSVVVVTKDAEGLKQQLLTGAFTPITLRRREAAVVAGRRQDDRRARPESRPGQGADHAHRGGVRQVGAGRSPSGLRRAARGSLCRASGPREPHRHRTDRIERELEGCRAGLDGDGRHDRSGDDHLARPQPLSAGGEQVGNVAHDADDAAGCGFGIARARHFDSAQQDATDQPGRASASSTRVGRAQHDVALIDVALENGLDIVGGK